MVDNPRVSQLYKIILAQSDLYHAEQLSNYIMKQLQITDDLWVPLQDAVIINHARPFTRNEPFRALPP